MKDAAALSDAAAELHNRFRAAAEFPRTYLRTLSFVRKNLATLLPTVVVLAMKPDTQAGKVAVRILGDLADDGVDTLYALYQCLPEKTSALAGVAAKITNYLYKALVLHSGQFDAAEVQLLNNLSERLQDNEQASEALEAAERAVAACRTLEAPSDQNRRITILCLGTLAKRRAELGQHREAAKVAKEAYNGAIKLAELNSEGDRLVAAQIAINLANRVAALGHHEEAAGVAKDALQHFARMPAADERFPYDVGLAEYALASNLTGLGRHAESLVHAERAEALFRKLTPDEPDFYIEYHAAAADVLSQNLVHTGEPKKAYSLSFQAQQRLAPLAARQPRRFGREYVAHLVNHADSASEVGNFDEAIDLATSALSKARKLWQRFGAKDYFLEGRIANLLFNLYYRVGQFTNAKRLAKLSISCFEPLSVEHPVAIEELARAFRNLAEAERVLANSKTVLRVVEIARKAVATVAKCEHQNSEAVQLLTAHCNSALAACLSDAGARSDAVSAERVSLTIREHLSMCQPAQYARELAYSKSRLARYLLDVSQSVEALELAEDALELYCKVAVCDGVAIKPFLTLATQTFVDALIANERPTESSETLQKAIRAISSLNSE